MKPRSERSEQAWVWRSVQMEWADNGWRRLETVVEREPRLVALVVVALLVVVGAIGAAAMASLPAGLRLILVVPVLLVSFVATGWSVLPWIASTDRGRARLPIGVLVVSVAVCCLGGWWLVPGLGGAVGAAALGVRESRLTGRDLELERLREAL